MTRWLPSCLLLISVLLPAGSRAQDRWVAPNPYEPSQQYVAHQNTEWGHAQPVVCESDLYAQLYPKERWDLFRRDETGCLPALAETARHSWIRLDYLFWSISGPDQTLLGAPVPDDPLFGPFDLTGVDRTRRLPAQDRVSGIRTFTSAVVPNIGQVEQTGISGFRGNVGIPLAIGDLEANMWLLTDWEEDVNQPPMIDTFIPGINQFLIGAVTLTEAGQPSDSTMVLFSESYQATLATNLWGTEVNVVGNAFTPNVAVEVHPIVGLQYVNMEDMLRIAGQDIPTPGTTLDHLIRSDAKNQVFGPQVGLRFSASKSRLTLQTDAKFMMAFNRIENRLATQQIFSATEDPRFLREDRTRFAPMFDLSVSAKCQATHHLSFFIAYDLLVGAGISRAYDNIVYDASVSTSDPPAIRLQDQVDNFYVHGLVLGGEIVFH